MEPTSIACAAALLNAWEGEDIASLRHHIDSALQPPQTDLCELERERHELLSAIAESMRDAQTGCDMQTPLALLRHLASAGGAGLHPAADLQSAFTPSNHPLSVPRTFAPSARLTPKNAVGR